LVKVVSHLEMQVPTAEVAQVVAPKVDMEVAAVVQQSDWELTQQI
jgi:hypothetical protein